jgi:hypothetical protein
MAQYIEPFAFKMLLTCNKHELALILAKQAQHKRGVIITSTTTQEV